MTDLRAKQSATPVCLSDYERLAEQHLDANAWAYFSGGSADELTVRWNRQAFDNLKLLPHVLRGGEAIDTRITLLGKNYTHPIFIAPVAHQKLAHNDGECATAAAAQALEAGMILSSLANTPMEAVAAAGATCRWFQLYFQSTREATLKLVRRAEAAGFEALVVTVDAPVNGIRNREHRVAFHLPPGVFAANLPDGDDSADAGGDGNERNKLERLMIAAPRWADIAWLKTSTNLPIIIKGILAPDDAVEAINSGVAAIIVSNHGGRTLDTVPATIEILPAIAQAVSGRLPLMLDGGIRRGTDVVKALALGASAVLIGRPVVYGLSVAGAFGVAHVLRLLRDELEIAMALTGRTTISQIKPDILYLP